MPLEQVDWSRRHADEAGVTGNVRIIRDVLDGVKMRMIREDKLN